MSRSTHLFRLVVAGLFLLLPRINLAQEQWQAGPDIAFLFKRFHSNDAGGFFKPHFYTATPIGGLHLSHRLSHYDAWVETGILYTSLDASVAEANQPGYSSYGIGSGLWVIPTLLRKDIILQLPGTYARPKTTVRLSFSAGVQHQFLANSVGWRTSSGSSGNGSGLSYTDHTVALHMYNPALFVESSVRLLLVRRRLDALFRINASLGLRQLIRTDIRYTTSATATPQPATVTYSGNGTGWGIGLRYLIH